MKKKISFLIVLLILPIMVLAEKVEFRGVERYGDFQVDSHYIITVYSPGDSSWYAIGVGDSGSPVSVKIDNPKNGLDINQSDLKTSNYIFTGTKKSANYSLKFRSNIIDSASGKKYSFYLNSSLFNLGGGDIRLNKYQYNQNSVILFGFSYRNQKFLSFNGLTKSFEYDSYTSSYIYNLNNGLDYGGSPGTQYFYVLTDDEGIDHSNEEVTLNKIKTIGAAKDVLYYSNRSDKTQFVYTYGNDKYIITPNGSKKVNISNDTLTTKDYYSYDINENYFSDGFINGGNLNDEELINDIKDTQNGWGSYLYTYGGYPYYYNGSFLNLNVNQESLFLDDNYYYYNDGVYLYYKEPFTTNLYTDRDVNPVSDEDYLNVAFNESAKFKICNYYPSSSYSNSSNNVRCIGWNPISKDFIKVNNINDAVLFELYSNKELIEKRTVWMYSPEGDWYSVKTTVTDQDLYKIDNKLYTYMDGNGNVQYQNKNYRFVGFTDDASKAGVVKLEDNENIIDYNKKNKRVEVTSSFKEKYSIVSKLSEAKVENGIVKLYPVLFNDDVKEEPYIGKADDLNILAVKDWKNSQTGTNQNNLNQYDINQGSINIEVYKDGKLWLNKDKVYYKYHNDNAADLVIKFVDSFNPGYEYENMDESGMIGFLNMALSNNKPSVFKLYIVGIYAHQGSSEEGLYMEFNAANENGAVLDNVKGGSTVKIYLSTKYTLKYYLDDVLYKSDNLKYVPTVTKRLINDNSSNSNYVVNSKNNKELLNLTGDNNHFNEDDMERGAYTSFSYELSNLLDTAEVFELPEEDLVYQFWAIKDENGDVNNKALPKEYVQLLNMDNLDYLFLGNDDEINTIHLYAYTKKYKNTPKLNEKELNKISIDLEELKTIDQEAYKEIVGKENPETSDGIKTFLLIALLCMLIIIGIKYMRYYSFKR